MAIREIPIVPGVRSSSRRVHLGGREYAIGIRWSDFEAAWYLTLAAASGVVLVAGIRLVVDEPLLEPYHHLDGVPAGELVVIDRRAVPTLGLEDLGDLARLTYVDPAEDTLTIDDFEVGA